MLKLAKLPDRTQTKITIAASATLNRDLQDYTALYRTTYGEGVSVADLIPFILESFLKSDPALAKARREAVRKGGKAASATLQPQQKD